MREDRDKNRGNIYASQTNIGLYIAHVSGNVYTYNYGQPQGSSKLDRHQKAQEGRQEAPEGEHTVFQEVEPTESDGGSQRPAVLENSIFRSHDSNGPVDMEVLWQWIDSHFIKRLINQYDWFALWRVLMDARMIRNSKTTTRLFVAQMKSWFPDPPQPCREGSINVYRSGYLGQTAATDWDEERFERLRKGKQRTEGYKRLKDLTADLWREIGKARRN